MCVKGKFCFWYSVMPNKRSGDRGGWEMGWGFIFMSKMYEKILKIPLGLLSFDFKLETTCEIVLWLLIYYFVLSNWASTNSHSNKIFEKFKD